MTCHRAVVVSLFLIFLGVFVSKIRVCISWVALDCSLPCTALSYFLGAAT